MTFWPFKSEDMLTVSEALEIAEDKTGDYYKFSAGQWRRHPYDIKTLSELKRYQIVPNAFALLHKCANVLNGFELKTHSRDVYFICLQDHQILKALNRDENLGLLPLLVYVFTHELVHIVRFSHFFERFEISGKGKEKEERVVHKTTHEILKDLPLPRLDYVLESYEGHRICDLAAS
jgi:hypothetical protein